MRMAPVLLLTILATGCAVGLEPARAMPTYPVALHRSESVDVHVFRDNTHLEIVNSTPRSYRDVVVWINQRYARRVESIPAGATVRLRLKSFYDDLGERFRAGGLLRIVEPLPVRLVELQENDTSPMIGLVTIREDDPF